MASTSTPAASDVVTPAAEATAQHLESAVKHKDEKAYDKTMSEINDFRRQHPESAQAFATAVTNRLKIDEMLPQVQLFEAKRDFDQIDFTHNGRLTQPFVDQFKKRGDVNEVQQALLTGATNDSNPLLDKGVMTNGLRKDQIDNGLTTRTKHREELQHLFEKGADGKSLYDRITNMDGDVASGTWEKMTGLSNADKQTLQYLRESRGGWAEFYDGLRGKDRALGHRELKALCDENHLDYENLKAHGYKPEAAGAKPTDQKVDDKASTDKTAADKAAADKAAADKAAADKAAADKAAADKAAADKAAADKAAADKAAADKAAADKAAADKAAADKAAADKAAADKAALDQKILDARTVKPGQSYAQTAEALLALAGVKDPSAEQLHKLTHQLWVADGHRKAYTLPKGHVLNLSPEIRANKDVAKLLHGLPDVYTAPQKEGDC